MLSPSSPRHLVSFLLFVSIVMVTGRPAAAQWKQYDYAQAKLSIAFPGEPESVPAEDGVSFGMQYLDEQLGTFLNVQVVGLEAADVAGGSKASRCS